MSDFDAGARLRELRTAAGMSQRQLAEASGVPHGQISMIETGRSSPSVASLRKILSGLSVTMSEFFEPDLPQSPQPFFTPAELRDLTSRLYNLQILHERYEPGADTGETMLAHHGSKGGIVIAGEVELTVGDQSRVLKAATAICSRRTSRTAFAISRTERRSSSRPVRRPIFNPCG
ncbi:MULTISPECIES: helix-turn-helix domain-containing protein [unclassified Paracoccus (in: a-proteobacteria)]|uniref:helix-turn-helix domain-containing protein n=1 Tax=unclassified Paracoccus (in: a-proteobacteria) TaxID=2688777 RepID=UPI000225F2CF|nr:transcriptional regulator, XRE family with cupin sensor [Paracoccus sp. J56]